MVSVRLDEEEESSSESRRADWEALFSFASFRESESVPDNRELKDTVDIFTPFLEKIAICSKHSIGTTPNNFNRSYSPGRGGDSPVARQHDDISGFLDLGKGLVRAKAPVPPQTLR
jgi:hypothetical protein